MSTEASLPGTSSCSLPASSEPNNSMLGGMSFGGNMVTRNVVTYGTPEQQNLSTKTLQRAIQNKKKYKRSEVN